MVCYGNGYAFFLCNLSVGLGGLYRDGAGMVCYNNGHAPFLCNLFLGLRGLCRNDVL